MGIIVYSLFNGMSCANIALDRAGIDVDKFYSSEVDKYAIQVEKHNYPNNISLGSVTEWSSWNVDKVDLVLGGSPCQGFSMSGKRGGTRAIINGEEILVDSLELYYEAKDKGAEFLSQSHLFWEYVAFLNYAKKINPNVKFLLENVKMNKVNNEMITKALGVEPVFINSSMVSAQSRGRLYWTNIQHDRNLEDKGLFLKDILDVHYSEKEVLSENIQKRFKLKETSYSIGSTSPEFRKIGQRDIVYGENNKMGCLMASDYKQPKQVYFNGVLRKISPEECEKLQTVPVGYTSSVSNTQRYKMLGNGWTIDVIAHILKGIKKEGME